MGKDTKKEAERILQELSEGMLRLANTVAFVTMRFGQIKKEERAVHGKVERSGTGPPRIILIDKLGVLDYLNKRQANSKVEAEKKVIDGLKDHIDCMPSHKYDRCGGQSF